MFQVKRWLKKHGSLNKTERKSGFLNFSSRCEIDVKPEEANEKKSRIGRTFIIDEIEKAWRAMSTEEKAV